MPEGTRPKRPAHPPREAPEDPPSLPLRMYLPGEPSSALPPPSRVSCAAGSLELQWRGLAGMRDAKDRVGVATGQWLWGQRAAAEG